MLESLIRNKTIPYELLKEVKIQIGEITIPLEDFIELKIRQVLDDVKEEFENE